ncbi:MAG: 2-oxoacid:acceptor oxidoreductase family protein [Candidatus Nanoarchaeia archaeon]|nr:2-oxoacid:acceptor oxidoreductase family protein [Candidatus Nanoarchaeia archaeon]
MPEDIFEIVVHGRAGQGAKSMAQIIAEAAMFRGNCIQTFPSYSAEKTGAPMQAYVRISKKPIKTHSPVRKADAVIVLDPTLLETIDLNINLTDKSVLVINTTKPLEKIRKGIRCKCRVVAFDAEQVSINHGGKNFPNMPLLGAFAKTAGILDLKSITEHVRCIFLHKLGQEITAKNIEAVKAGYGAV